MSSERRQNTMSKLHESAPRVPGQPIDRFLFGIYEINLGDGTFEYTFIVRNAFTHDETESWSFTASSTTEAGELAAAALIEHQPEDDKNIWVWPGLWRWDILLELCHCRNCYPC